MIPWTLFSSALLQKGRQNGDLQQKFLTTKLLVLRLHLFPKYAPLPGLNLWRHATQNTKLSKAYLRPDQEQLGYVNK